jgi:hypothetical protein
MAENQVHITELIKQQKRLQKRLEQLYQKRYEYEQCGVSLPPNLQSTITQTHVLIAELDIEIAMYN